MLIYRLYEEYPKGPYSYYLFLKTSALKRKIERFIFSETKELIQSHAKRQGNATGVKFNSIKG